jgi:hypothetical protein
VSYGARGDASDSGEGLRIVWQPEKNANNELNVENCAVLLFRGFTIDSRARPATDNAKAFSSRELFGRNYL